LIVGYAVAAGVPMLEPSDSQEAYDMMFAALEISERWQIPTLLRATTRVCHSYTVVRPRPTNGAPKAAHFERDIRKLVMIPAYARPAHRRCCVRERGLGWRYRTLVRLEPSQELCCLPQSWRRKTQSACVFHSSGSGPSADFGWRGIH
jgi:hypothetical protein